MIQRKGPNYCDKRDRTRLTEGLVITIEPIIAVGTGSVALNSGAVITNRAEGLFHAQNASALVANVGVGHIDNVGTFRTSAGTGTTTRVRDVWAGDCGLLAE